HRQIGHQRIRKNKPWRALGAVDLVIDADAVGFDLHGRSFHRYFLKKSRSSRTSVFGPVVGRKWPASSTSSKRAPGIFLASSSVRAGGRTVSCLPATTRGGTEIFGSM